MALPGSTQGGQVILKCRGQRVEQVLVQGQLLFPVLQVQPVWRAALRGTGLVSFHIKIINYRAALWMRWVS